MQDSESTYYNEFDPNAAAWLRELIAMGEIPGGAVDARDIRDVAADDVRRFRRVHFFSGIAGWEYALQLAGWPLGRAVWTGSCPCQPYSSAGQGKGDDDPRNLWPEFFRLIRECRPDTIFGEQVESAIGHGWLDRVSRDLEGEGYAVGATVLGAHSVGAPHIRQRLYWVAHLCREGLEEFSEQSPRRQLQAAERGGEVGGPTEREQWKCFRCFRDYDKPSHTDAFHDDGTPAGVYYCPACRDPRRMGNSPFLRWLESPEIAPGSNERGKAERAQQRPWDDFDVIPCRDGKARRVKPGSFPLVAGLPKGVVHCRDPVSSIDADATAEARVMRLKGYGNSIVAPLAAEFIRAFMECENA